ncbi:uncharacterized protein LOC125039330 [Penaeus chinensis]|uniref:uncharacterized protein LOC125039330 n=1 Tax=Penaeus chinensis TaxID=139456 RepID=UPI001FB855A0|nr:uncharacterized protein LOC125039330 [Penaeus chinensis]
MGFLLALLVYLLAVPAAAPRATHEEEKNQWLLPGICHVFNVISVFILTCLYILKEMESPFWEIVFTNDLNHIKNFLRSKIKSIYEEIRRPAKSFYGKKPARLRIPEPLCRAAASISARKRMMTWTERTKALFEAAEWGMYTDEGGVHEAMATFGLPATVKDCHGWSVLHYAASMRFADDSPVWELRDIRKYVEQHQPFPNAVDHWGQTALHVLAQHPRGSLEAVLGRKKRMHNVAGAWVAIACLLIKYGCDPKIQDKQGKRAGDRAREFNNAELAQLLEQVLHSTRHKHRPLLRMSIYLSMPVPYLYLFLTTYLAIFPSISLSTPLWALGNFLSITLVYAPRPHLYTWTSTDKRSRKQIDYIMIDRQRKSAIKTRGQYLELIATVFTNI